MGPAVIDEGTLHATPGSSPTWGPVSPWWWCKASGSLEVLLQQAETRNSAGGNAILWLADRGDGCFSVWLLASTDAFEVSMNGQLIFSKKSCGRFPSPQEVGVFPCCSFTLMEGFSQAKEALENQVRSASRHSEQEMWPVCNQFYRGKHSSMINT